MPLVAVSEPLGIKLTLCSRQKTIAASRKDHTEQRNRPHQRRSLLAGPLASRLTAGPGCKRRVTRETVASEDSGEDACIKRAPVQVQTKRHRHTDTDIDTDRHTDTQTQTQTQTDKHIHTHTHTHTHTRRHTHTRMHTAGMSATCSARRASARAMK
jgi:hypothetical protein